MPRESAPPTLRALLAREDLRLRLVSDPAALAPEALDQPLRWVHSSDLADPTPFLADDLVLLTTGTQFTGGAAAEPALFRDYVGRLRRRGVIGLGFGTEVVPGGIPAALVAACHRQRMPLFEVPYSTPFIAVARAGAEAIAAQGYARRTWALAAQRALSLAALRPDGLGATVAELARQLGCWVGLYDTGAALIRQHPAGDLGTGGRDRLSAEVGAMLRRGTRAATTVEESGRLFTVQTLGGAGRLRGAIAFAATDLDLAGRGVVTSVIAMAGLALEQNVALSRARDALRAGLVQSLLTDDPALVRPVARALWGGMPVPPLQVAVADVSAAREAAAGDWLELRAGDTGGALFHGRGPDGLVIVTGADTHALIDEFAELFGATAGVAEAADYTWFRTAHERARDARRRARSDEKRLVRFAELTRAGVFARLTEREARASAEAQLAPLTDHDRANGADLRGTVRVWLAHDARIDAAAHALGIHRHTVRARIGQAQRLLGVDLSLFTARAELWAALVATDESRG